MAEETDVDFSQVKGVRIKNGEVNYITDTPPSKLYWKRPFRWGKMAYCCLCSKFSTPRGSKLQRFLGTSILRDKYGITWIWEYLPNGSKTSDGFSNSWGSCMGVFLPSYTDEIDESNFNDDYTIISRGLKEGTLGMTAYHLTSEADELNFPNIEGCSNPNYILSQNIKLYATPMDIKNSEQSALGWEWAKRGFDPLYQEWFHEYVKHETDVTIPVETPFITFGKKQKNFTPITSVRNNFDEYKEKYDTATDGKYPKSTYPYLVGHVYLESTGCNSNPVLDGIDLVFCIKR